MNWEKVKLGEVCTKIGSGATPKGGATVYVKKGTTFIRSQNVYNLSFDYSGLVYINDEAAKKLNGVSVEENDILINITGDSVARTCIVPSEVLPARVNQHVAIIRPCKDRLNPNFLNYYLASPYMQSHMLGLAVGKGASRNAMTKGMIEGFEVYCPSLDIQSRIVDILSAYDNLIENNQKQIKLLEEAAQRLYKEWFVDLRFPGYENVAIVDGIPEGWKRSYLSEIVGYEIGGGWGEELITEKCNQPAYVIRGTDLFGITNGNISEVPFRYHDINNLKSRKLMDGDIIFEVSGGSKKEGVARTVLIRNTILDFLKMPVMCASFCKLVRAKDKQYAQILFEIFKYMRSSGKTGEYDKKSASSIVNYRWKDFLDQETVLIPNEELLLKYNALSENMYKMILAKSIEIEKNKEVRDRLLPKLMSGEIEV